MSHAIASVLKPRMGSAVIHVDDAIPVRITVRRDLHGTPEGIVVHPDDHHPPVIHARPSGERVPGRLPRPPVRIARQVLWVVDDLRRGEVLRIQAKTSPPQGHYFHYSAFVLDHEGPAVASGSARLPVPLRKPGARFEWRYDITVEGGHLHAPVTLDPMIIIEDGP